MSEVTILIFQIRTPIGIMTAAATDKGICMLELSEKTEFKNKHNYDSKKSTNKHLKQCEKELVAYFNKERATFDVPLDLIGTDFQIKVWKKLLTIPFGSTQTYK